MPDTKEEDLGDFKSIKEMRQYYGYRIWEIDVKYRVLLNKRITPLLTDAFDAIEIDAPSTALKRIEAVLKVIKETTSKPRP